MSTVQGDVAPSSMLDLFADSGLVITSMAAGAALGVFGTRKTMELVAAKINDCAGALSRFSMQDGSDLPLLIGGLTLKHVNFVVPFGFVKGVGMAGGFAMRMLGISEEVALVGTVLGAVYQSQQKVDAKWFSTRPKASHPIQSAIGVSAGVLMMSKLSTTFLFVAGIVAFLGYSQLITQKDKK